MTNYNHAFAIILIIGKEPEAGTDARGPVERVPVVADHIGSSKATRRKQATLGS